jgi:hypothetical protein
VLLEVDDAILAQELDVIVDPADVAVDAIGERADALGRRVHRTPHQFEPAGSNRRRNT